jgi:hypothetical protein
VTSSLSSMAMTSGPLMPGTRSSALRSAASESSGSGVVNWVNCSARKTGHSSAGSISRAATTARQARAVAARRGLGWRPKGMP